MSFETNVGEWAFVKIARYVVKVIHIVLLVKNHRKNILNRTISFFSINYISNMSQFCVLCFIISSLKLSRLS